MVMLFILSCTPDETLTPDTVECANDNRVQIGNDFQFITPYESNCYAVGNDFTTHVTFDQTIFPQGLWRMYIRTADMEEGVYDIVFTIQPWIERNLPDGKAMIMANTKELNQTSSDSWFAQSGTLTLTQTAQGNTVRCYENVLFLNTDTEETMVISATIICE